MIVGLNNILSISGYPFGESMGDSVAAASVDGSTPPIMLSQSFPFFGVNRTVLYVSLNMMNGNADI